MKKTIFAALMVCSLGLMTTSCDSDRDSNPIIQEPTTFVLNTPAYANEVIDLANSKEIRLTCSQPDYGYTAAVIYTVQVSLDGAFTKDVTEATEEDPTFDYVTLDETFTSCKLEVKPNMVAKAVQQLANYEEGAVPETQTVKVRLHAAVDNYTINSNTVDMIVSPYYVELKDADPDLWYLIGACIGDGKWSNGWGGVGASMFPMGIVKDYDYDKKTGSGEITWTGWLTPDGFKLVHTPGDWNEQWGAGDDGFVKNDGGSGNIAVAEAGYYTLVLNTATDEMTLTAADIEPASYETVGLIGLNNDWDNDIVMTPCGTDHNHMWYTEITVDANTSGKFRANASWDANWGGKTFPYGVGSQNGDNINVKAGTYIVFLNDIDGSYEFIAK